MMAAKYSEADRAGALSVLDGCGGNVKEASARLGIPYTTLIYWRDGGAVNPDVTEVRNEKRRDLADVFEEVAYGALGLAPDAMSEATFAQLMTGAGIAVDKMQLLRKLPTVITEDVSSLPDDELDRRIAALERGEVPAADIPETPAAS